jgi:hypothetical protein
MREQGSSTFIRPPSIAILLTILASIGVFVAYPTAAFASCNPGRAYNGYNVYFAGWSSPFEVSGEATADSSQMYNYPSPYVYPRSGDFAWVMLVDAGENGCTNYAQVGWVQDPGRNTFTEWTNGACHLAGYDFNITPQPQGQSSWYEVDTYNSQVSTDYCFFVNGSEVGGCSGATGWIAAGGQDYGEIHTAADQMPGAVHQPEYWENSFLFDNNVQENFNGTMYRSATWFNIAKYSATLGEEDDAYCTGT